MKKRIITLAAASLVLPAVSFGAGYALFQGSAAGIANAAGSASKGGEPGSMYYNPATVVELPGTQVQIGIAEVLPAASVRTVNPYSGAVIKSNADSRLWSIPSAFVTHQINDSFWFAMGMYSRFGLGAELPQDWPGRYANYKSMITALDFAPNLVWKVNDNLSLSAGIAFRYFDIELAQKIDAAGMVGLRNYQDPSYSPYDVDQNLQACEWGLGFDLGLRYKPCDSVYLGLAYHSRVKLDIDDGDAKWTKPAAVQAIAPTFFNSTGVNCVNRNPDEVVFSASWDATDRLTVGAGVIYTHWAIFDSFDLSFDSDMVPGVSEVSSKKDWHDAWRFMLGAEYKLSETLRIRGSYTYDGSPLNSTTLDYLVPGDNRHIFAVGFGRDFGAWTIDMSYFYELVCDMDVNGMAGTGVFDGEFLDADAHCLAVSVTRRF